MPLVSENFHKKKLENFHINIKTKYIVGNQILEKNTDDSYNDDIRNGIRCKKEYYVDQKLAHEETSFDSRIEYTFISKEEENEDHTCPNCGMTSKLKSFIDGCPYCGTYYNIDYTDKDLGSKYHYDKVLKNTTYRITTAVIDLAVSLLLSFFFVKLTSRTFNSYDIAKVFIYGIILATILYYFFYTLDAYVILAPIKRYKDRQNQRQIDFWDRTKIDKKTFFNNLNYEVRKHYYSTENIIDYDVLDYLEFQDFRKDGKLHVSVTAEVRIVSYENNQITSKLLHDTYIMKRHENGTIERKDDCDVIECHNCGASIDITKERCDYCDSEIKYLQEWSMETGKD